MFKKANRWHTSFTILELLIVAVIIAILAAAGSIQYTKTLLKARVAKARHGIALIAEAERICQADSATGSFIAIGSGDSVETKIGTNVSGIALAALDNDADWGYTVVAASGVVTATKSTTPCQNDTITYDIDDGTWTIAGCLD